MKFKRIVALLMVAALGLCVFAACAKTETPTDENADNSDKISATIVLVLEDASEVKYDISVAKDQTIRQALYEAKLIDDENNVAMFVSTIDGHTADAVNDGVTWTVCDENGNELTGGDANAICALDKFKVEDGQTIKLVYTVVPMFDD